jgi:hypothetical protein
MPLFKRLNGVFRFNLDVCAEEWNTKVPNNYITPEQDGLATDWMTRRPDSYPRYFTAWMNPPYGDQVGLWTAKAVEESKGNGINTVALLASRTDAKWFHRDCARAAHILFLDKRVRFCLPCLLCGQETDKRRKPSLARLAEMELAGMDVTIKQSFPLCDTCQAAHIYDWHKPSSNSPAVGSMVVAWGKYPRWDVFNTLQSLGLPVKIS